MTLASFLRYTSKSITTHLMIIIISKSIVSVLTLQQILLKYTSDSIATNVILLLLRKIGNLLEIPKSSCITNA